MIIFAFVVDVVVVVVATAVAVVVAGGWWLVAGAGGGAGAWLALVLLSPQKKFLEFHEPSLIT